MPGRRENQACRLPKLHQMGVQAGVCPQTNSANNKSPQSQPRALKWLEPRGLPERAGHRTPGPQEYVVGNARETEALPLQRWSIR